MAESNAAGHSAPPQLTLVALSTMPSVAEGDDLPSLIAGACELEGIALATGDVLVVAQKIVSKAEGRRVRLATVSASARAVELAARTGKDPRLVELILRESVRVLRVAREALIVEHRLGYVLANAGIDQSNVSDDDADPSALLLPEDPDRSAARLREHLAALTGVLVSVIINDSIGRAWRLGTIGTALGVAGLPALADLRGTPDMHGRRLRSTLVAVGDELASAASLCMGQAAERRPVVIVRGYTAATADPAGGRRLLRPLDEDLFR
jgi:coenzyme F420-0:L-glutamate ligase/coenzyme F420-1:gamma-L-glutamate ligase